MSDSFCYHEDDTCRGLDPFVLQSSINIFWTDGSFYLQRQVTEAIGYASLNVYTRIESMSGVN